MKKVERKNINEKKLGEKEKSMHTHTCETCETSELHTAMIEYSTRWHS